MAFFDNVHFPFFTLQELNLDWLLQKIKGMLAFLPDDGSVGQVLRRTTDGAEWSDEGPLVAPVTSVNNKTGAVIVPYTNSNLLDNWYFIDGGSQNGDGYFPINTKGQTTYTTSGITIDRWYNDDLSSIQLHADGLGIYGSGSISSMYQILDSKNLYGKTVTASVWDSTNHLTIGTAVCPQKPASGWNYATIINATVFNIVIAVKSDGEIRLIIQAKNSASFIISAIKLELGSEQTLLHTENGMLVFNEIPNWYAEYDRIVGDVVLYPTYDTDVFKDVFAYKNGNIVICDATVKSGKLVAGYNSFPFSIPNVTYAVAPGLSFLTASVSDDVKTFYGFAYTTNIQIRASASNSADLKIAFVGLKS